MNILFCKIANSPSWKCWLYTVKIRFILFWFDEKSAIVGASLFSSKQLQRHVKNANVGLTKFKFSHNFISKFKKVDSATETRGSDGSESVHNLVFHFEYIEYIVLKDLAIYLVNLEFFWGRIFKKCQIQLEKAIFCKNHYHHINSH